MTKDYEGLDRLATESNLCRPNKDNLEDTPGELEYAVTQIASLNPDAPFVIGRDSGLCLFFYRFHRNSYKGKIGVAE